MTKDFLLGIALIFLSGIFNGSFAWPMKYTRRWRWENLWLFFTFLALFVMPLLLTVGSVPQLRELYMGAPAREFLPAIIFGFLWGIAQVTYGLGIAAVGMALAVAVVTGLTGLLGSLIPMVVLNPADLLRPMGISLLAGMPILILGLVLYGMAGLRREEEQKSRKDRSVQRKMSFAAGLAICVFTGVFGSMLNFGFAFSGSLLRRSVQLGANPAFSTYAVWTIVLAAGFVPNILYCCYLLVRNRTWGLYRSQGWPREAALAAAMAVLWLAGVFGYGSGATFLRSSGTSLGFAVFVSSVVLASNLLGVFTGEWDGTTIKTKRLLTAAVIAVLLSVGVLGLGGLF